MHNPWISMFMFILGGVWGYGGRDMYGMDRMMGWMGWCGCIVWVGGYDGYRYKLSRAKKWKYGM